MINSDVLNTINNYLLLGITKFYNILNIDIFMIVLVIYYCICNPEGN